ncbi:hypothetical protein B566_EDAN012519 [Ephemera danica]|nr:hypothetical protein B566_EDAN012519 [Ephemera danica]
MVELQRHRADDQQSVLDMVGVSARFLNGDVTDTLAVTEKRHPLVTRAFSEEVTGEHSGNVQQKEHAQTRDETPSTGELSRAMSWPLLKAPEERDVQTPQLEIRPPRRFVQVRGAGGRLWQHYYPEGGWGWIVVTCAALVHALGHGLQLSFAVLVAPLVLKFAPHHLIDTSE